MKFEAHKLRRNMLQPSEFISSYCVSTELYSVLKGMSATYGNQENATELRMD